MNVNNWNFRQIYSQTIRSTTYLTHGIHSYTAKLIPHIPRYFVGKYTQKNGCVLDPFCGSGTTLLETKLLKRNAIGIDINPLAKLISEVKTTPLNIEELHHSVQAIKEKLENGTSKNTVNFPNIDYWFSRNAQNELARIKYNIEKLKKEVDSNIHKFLLLCFSSIIRKSSYADTRMAKTYKSKRVRKKIENGWVPTPIHFFEEAIDKLFDKMKSSYESLNSDNNWVKVFQGDAKETSLILKQNGIKKIDFIITSPPYINAQDYFRSYKLELWWLGLASPSEVRQLNRLTIGTERLIGAKYNSRPRSENQLLNKLVGRIWNRNRKKAHVVHKYFENMAEFLKQCNTVLTKNGKVCLISGNNTICGFEIPTYKILTRIAENFGFRLLEIGKDRIKNRSLSPNRKHEGGIIKEEWILVFQK